jgi:hypothetical protein
MSTAVTSPNPVRCSAALIRRVGSEGDFRAHSSSWAPNNRGRRENGDGARRLRPTPCCGRHGAWLRSRVSECLDMHAETATMTPETFTKPCEIARPTVRSHPSAVTARPAEPGTLSRQRHHDHDHGHHDRDDTVPSRHSSVPADGIVRVDSRRPPSSGGLADFSGLCPDTPSGVPSVGSVLCRKRARNGVDARNSAWSGDGTRSRPVP